MTTANNSIIAVRPTRPDPPDFLDPRLDMATYYRDWVARIET